MGSTPVGISGSRASAILELNKYQTQFEVWQKIMEERKPDFNESRGYIFPDDPENAAIRWGNAFESSVLGLIGEVVNDREKYFERMYVSPPELKDNVAFGLDMNDVLKITCHIDGMLDSGMLVEAKTTSFYSWQDNWGEPGSDRIPEEYAIQCQHNMLCSGATECLVPVLVFPKRVEEFEKEGWVAGMATMNGDDIWIVSKGGGSVGLDVFKTQKEWAKRLSEMGYYHEYRIKANPDIQKKLLDLYQKWWNDHVLGENPPEAKSYDDILRMLPKASGIVKVPDELIPHFRRYQKMGQVGKSVKEARERLKVKLLSHFPALVEEDESSPDKMLFQSEYGDRLASYSGNRFIVNVKEGT